MITFFFLLIFGITFTAGIVSAVLTALESWHEEQPPRLFGLLSLTALYFLAAGACLRAVLS